MKPIICIVVAGRQVRVRAWRYLAEGITGHVVPVHLLDTFVVENTTGMGHCPITSKSRWNGAEVRLAAWTPSVMARIG